MVGVDAQQLNIHCDYLTLIWCRLEYLEPLRASDVINDEDAEQLTMEFGDALRQFRSTLEK